MLLTSLMESRPTPMESSKYQGFNGPSGMRPYTCIYSQQEEKLSSRCLPSISVWDPKHKEDLEMVPEGTEENPSQSSRSAILLLSPAELLWHLETYCSGGLFASLSKPVKRSL